MQTFGLWSVWAVEGLGCGGLGCGAPAARGPHAQVGRAGCHRSDDLPGRHDRPRDRPPPLHHSRRRHHTGHQGARPPGRSRPLGSDARTHT
eukprot:4172012-Prymnesium_polylepis.1